MSTASTLATAISNRLKEITIANGYATDIGLRSFRGRRSLTENHMPCSVLVEGDDMPTSQALKGVVIRQTYAIEGHDACDANNPNDKAHLILGDIKRCIFGGDTEFGGLVKQVFYKGRNIQPREDGQAVVSASIVIEVQFVEDLTNP